MVPLLMAVESEPPPRKNNCRFRRRAHTVPIAVNDSVETSEVSAMKPGNLLPSDSLDRRAFLARAAGAVGASAAAALRLTAAEPPGDSGADYLKELEENERKARSKDAKATIGVGDKLKITKVE